MRGVAIAALLGAVLSGCIPLHVADGPGFDLTIVDSASRRPIVGARVETRDKRSNEVVSAAIADAGGHARAETPMRVIWIPPVPFDPASPDVWFDVAADGYAPRRIDDSDPLLVPTGCSDRKGLCWPSDTGVIALDALRR